MKKVCVISCPIATRSGYGARSRDFVRSLIQLKGDEWDIRILSQRWGQTPINALTPDDSDLTSRISRGSPVFIISSLEGDGTTLPAIRSLAGRGHEVIVLSPSSIDLERLVSRIPRLSYEVLKLERQNRLTAISGYGAKVIDWMPDVELSQALMQVKGS